MSTIFGGITIGRYEIVEKLDRGGMADVYLARNREGDGAEVALRVVEYRGADRDALEAERTGALLQQRLAEADPRVPRIHDFGEIDGYCFFVDMEYVAGEDLADAIRRGPLAPREAARIARELCDALAAAHAFSTKLDGREIRGIVHGDLKPKNIRIQPDGRVRILDFGIAKALSLTRLQTRNAFASGAYASPERLDSGAVDAQADLWAVGVMLYEMVSGRPPFGAESTQKLESLVRAGASFTALPPELCPPPLARIVHRALSFERAARFEGAEDFREALEAFLEHGRSPAPPAGSETRRSGAVPPAAPDGAAARSWGDGAGPPAVPAGAETRRTTRPEAPPRGGETKRTALTGPPPPALPAKKAEAGAPSPPKRPLGRSVVRALTGLVLVALLLGAVLQVSVYNEAKAIQRGLETRDIGPEEAWEQYRSLAAVSLIPWALGPARQPLREAFLSRADRVIDNYREHDNPTVREGDWQRAREHLVKAISLGGTDAGLRARLSYAEGHLARIDGRHREAIDHYLRAARLDPSWPDPYLGLANCYLYGLRDFEKTEQTIARLEELGHPLGRRERAQRADALYFHAMELEKACPELAGSDQEKDCLLRAMDGYRQAIARYEEILPWGRSVQNSRRAEQRNDALEARIADFELADWRARLKDFMGWD